VLVGLAVVAVSAAGVSAAADVSVAVPLAGGAVVAIRR
jgi:hypothetical protein